VLDLPTTVRDDTVVALNARAASCGRCANCMHAVDTTDPGTAHASSTAAVESVT